MKKNKWVVSPFFVIAVIFFLLHKIVPFVGYNTPSILNMLILAYMYAYIIMNKGVTFVRLSSSLMILGVNFLSLVYGAYNNLFTEIFGILQIVVCPLITLFLLQKDAKREINLIVFSVFIAYVVTSITTIIGNSVFPEASRQIAAMLNTEDPALYHVYMNMNIGSLKFVYTLALLIPVLIYVFKNKIVNRVIISGTIITFVMAVFASEYTTAILFLLMGSLPIIMHKSFKFKSLLFAMILIVLLFFVFENIFSTTLLYLADNVQSENVSERLTDLAFSIGGGNVDPNSDLAIRHELYGKSMEAFVISPIYGSLNPKIGGHSYVLDNMGSFGLIGLTMMFIMFRKIYQLFYKIYKNTSSYGYIMLVFTMAIVLSILNPQDYLIVHTMILPLTIYCLNCKLNHNESTLGCK